MMTIYYTNKSFLSHKYLSVAFYMVYRKSNLVLEYVNINLHGFNCIHLLCTLIAAHTFQSSYLALCPPGKSSPLYRRKCRLDWAQGK